MRIKAVLSTSLRRRVAAFSLVETTLSMAVIGTTVAALLSGITTGTFSMRMARENLRATQIMLEKVETIRLYSWDQITTAGFMPTNFTATYDPQGGTNVGLTYNGTMTITPAPITSSYSNDLRKVTVHLAWQTGNVPRSRDFSSYVARNGIESYIY